MEASVALSRVVAAGVGMAVSVAGGGGKVSIASMPTVMACSMPRVGSFGRPPVLVGSERSDRASGMTLLSARTSGVGSGRAVSPASAWSNAALMLPCGPSSSAAVAPAHESHEATQTRWIKHKRNIQII